MYSLCISTVVILTHGWALLHSVNRFGIECVGEASHYSFPASTGRSVSSSEGADMTKCATMFMHKGVTAVTVLIAGSGQGSGKAVRRVQLQ